MRASEVIELYNQYLTPNYRKVPFIFTKGKGSKVWDIYGKSYLDFFPGWGVSGLGHCPPRVVRAVQTQAKRILHVSNNYYHLLQIQLAKRIVELSFDGKVFFSNSGAEANEAAMKLARAYGHPDRYEFLSMEGSFHGRTLATTTLTGQAKYKEGFGPLPQGFREVPFNDLGAVERAMRKETVAIFSELIQGEGGIHVATPEFVRGLRKLCDEKKILLVFDEVQTGMGRTGKLFCFEHYGVVPDVMTLAKSLGGGLPIGAMVVRKPFADILKPGMHAATFGGSPLVCRASLAVFETIQKEKLLPHATQLGAYLFEALEGFKKRFPVIQEIRGKGLMVGMELKREGGTFVEKCAQRGLLLNCTQEKVIRIMPPLNATKKEMDQALRVIEEVLKA
ncbi:MAG: aspartate aminotransferase family protein [Candidatus Omnitrophica bacterium]|nr:aspartate aminotransferase family protein [Candidatus Omnitrophota bacterium]